MPLDSVGERVARVNRVACDRTERDCSRPPVGRRDIFSALGHASRTPNRLAPEIAQQIMTMPATDDKVLASGAAVLFSARANLKKFPDEAIVEQLLEVHHRRGQSHVM